MTDLDRAALVRGAIVAAVGAAAFAALANLAGSGPVALLMLGGLLGSAFGGGWVAATAASTGTTSPGRPITHGGVAAGLAFLAVQLAFSLVTLTAPNPVSVVLALGLFTSLGSLAGLAVSRRDAPEGRPPPR